MSTHQTIAIGTIAFRPDARPRDPERVAALAASIGEIGLINPIRVRPKLNDQWEIIAGGHRYEACVSLGFSHVECSEAEAIDDLRSELAMIDENLIRAELSPAERAIQTARRKTIYEELHPETKAGVAGAVAKHSAMANLATASFADATAAATGSSERAVRRDAERGEKVTPEAFELIHGTKLNTGAYLDKIKKLSPNDQVQAVKRDLAMDRQKAKEERRAQQVVHDATRDAARAALPPAVRAVEAAKQAAIAGRKTKSDDVDEDGLTPEDRIAELEESVRVLESENAKLKAENKLYGEMKAEFEKGGFAAVINGKEEVIRVATARIERESADKASWSRAAKYWQEQARKHGYSGNATIDIKTGRIVNG